MCLKRSTNSTIKHTSLLPAQPGRYADGDVNTPTIDAITGAIDWMSRWRRHQIFRSKTCQRYFLLTFWNIFFGPSFVKIMQFDTFSNSLPNRFDKRQHSCLATNHDDSRLKYLTQNWHKNLAPNREFAPIFLCFLVTLLVTAKKSFRFVSIQSLWYQRNRQSITEGLVDEPI